MQNIQRQELKSKIDDNPKNFHLIEVLDRNAYSDFHLPSAVNIPIESPNFETLMNEEAPKKSEEIVVYCANKDCDASTKAVQRLNDLGYTNVKDYVEGKEDWRKAGLSIESN